MAQPVRQRLAPRVADILDECGRRRERPQELCTPAMAAVGASSLLLLLLLLLPPSPPPLPVPVPLTLLRPLSLLLLLRAPAEHCAGSWA